MRKIFLIITLVGVLVGACVIIGVLFFKNFTSENNNNTTFGWKNLTYGSYAGGYGHSFNSYRVNIGVACPRCGRSSSDPVDLEVTEESADEENGESPETDDKSVWNFKDGPSRVPLGEIIGWFCCPDFYSPHSVADAPERVVRAKEILLECFEKGHFKQRFTPEQLGAFVYREAKCWDPKNPNMTVINLRTFGDRTLRYKSHGLFQLRKVAWGEVIYDKDNQMPIPAHLKKELRELGIQDRDFHDPLLALLVFEAWHHRYSSTLDFYRAAGTFNAGPTGFVNGGGRSYASAVVAKSKSLASSVVARPVIASQ